jgi:transcriptional regulator GlxA family with amidase domain
MTKTPRNPPTRTIEIVAFPDVQLLDVTGPLQVFASANEMRRLSGQPPHYAIRVVAKSSPVISSSGLAVLVHGLSPHERSIDTLIVAGGAGVHAASQDKRLISWLAERASAARRVASVCTGALVLGATGLLDGKRVVTHWAECERLARRYPKARVEIDPIFLQDGKVWTSAGVTAGIDMSLAMVEKDIGHAAAIAVARDLVVFLKRPGGQSQFSAALALQQSDSRLDQLHSWIAGHLAEDLSVPALAARARMSERTFLRHYSAAMGQTPARAVERMRVEAARQLLATTRLPIKQIAAKCGFGSEETMRRRVLHKVGVTPSEYRSRFSSAERRKGEQRKANANVR